MAWGITIKNVFIPRVKKEEIESLIEINEANISVNKERLLILASSTPRDVKLNSGEYVTWEYYVLEEVNKIVEEITSKAKELELLYVARNNFDDIIQD